MQQSGKICQVSLLGMWRDMHSTIPTTRDISSIFKWHYVHIPETNSSVFHIKVIQEVLFSVKPHAPAMCNKVASPPPRSWSKEVDALVVDQHLSRGPDSVK